MKKEYGKQQSYPTDLTDIQWEEIAPLFVGMREYKYSKRELLNAVLYLVDNGCKWRGLPHDFPPYSTVHSFYRRARLNETPYSNGYSWLLTCSKSSSSKFT